MSTNVDSLPADHFLYDQINRKIAFKLHRSMPISLHFNPCGAMEMVMEDTKLYDL
jgi:hypothetical protein